MKFETIENKHKAAVEKIYDRTNALIKARIKEVVRQLIKTGFDASNYTISMGCTFIGDTRSKEYTIFTAITNLVQIPNSYSDFTERSSYRERRYEEILEMEFTEDDYETPIHISRKQFDLMVEFHALGQSLQYGIER